MEQVPATFEDLALEPESTWKGDAEAIVSTFQSGTFSFDNGYMEDWPYASSSVGGGKANSYTIGLNYSFNRYVQCMVDYTYNRLQKDFLPYDKKVHVAQARVQFTF